MVIGDPNINIMFDTAAKYQATCVLNSTLNEYAVIIAIIGMILGIIFTLVFQYTRRKMKERIEAAEREEANENLENTL